MIEPLRLFVYGTMLPGERDAAQLAGAVALGPARTAEGYGLVEVGPLAGLVEGGAGSVIGELFNVDQAQMRALDRQPQHPNLFHRKPVRLDDGTTAEAFLLFADQVRGKRRIRGGDWRGRFQIRRPGELHEAGPLVSWARDRHRR